MSDLINRADVIDALWKALHDYEDKMEKQFIESDELDVDEWMVHRIFVQNMSDIDRQIIRDWPSAQPTLTCDGCRHAGTYDTEFPCCVCIRKEKDYYETDR